MKLSELMEKKQLFKTSTREITGMFHHPNLEHIGTGYQAIAYLHNKFPNSVVKTINVKGEHDPAYQFLRICLNHQNNPFFPKIYSVKKYKTKELNPSEQKAEYERLNKGADDVNIPPDQQEFLLVVVMEKLYDFEKTYGHDVAVQLLQKYGMVPQDLRRLADPFSGKVKDPLTQMNKPFRVKSDRRQLGANDPNFRQAMRLLEPLFKHFDPDMHSGNLMLRKTPNGPQMVFVDPFTYKLDDSW